MQDLIATIVNSEFAKSLYLAETLLLIFYFKSDYDTSLLIF